LEVLAASESVTYPLPTHASDELRTFWKSNQTLEPAPDFIARLPGGRVFGPGVVLAPEGSSLARDVSTDFGKPFAEHWVRGYAKMRPPEPVAGATAVVAVALGANYCHWLLEELPRLLMLGDRATRSVIAHRDAAFIREAFSYGGFSFRVTEAKRYSHYQCEELIVPSLVGRPGGPTPRAVRLLTEFAAPLLDRVGGRGERIYITREKAARRRVTNKTELWRHLEAHGFKQVVLEEVAWAEQINVFAQAKVIVAPHGAGLANLVFCQPGARVVELFNRAYVNPCFWRLAALKGLDYRPLIGGAGEGLACELKANREDIFADIDSVTKALA
jgi:capsular polysaccharide biosynthesis protein